MAKNPITVFIVTIHFPDLGNLFILLGKMAKKVNGKAKAIEKDNIPNIGFIATPFADWTNIPPIKGPIQEKETRTKVRAIKKIPTEPFWSDCLSIRLIKPGGKEISKKPRRENPNKIKRK